MRVIHVVPVIAEEASGLSYSVPRLCESLIKAGVDLQLAALDWAPMSVQLPFLKTFPLGFGPRRLGPSPDMRRWLTVEAGSGRVRILHNHSLWMMPTVYPGMVRRASGCRLVVSPHGTLSAWAMGWNSFQKKVFWRCFQAQTLQTADCFHATAASEFQDIRRHGFRQPVCILPNGIGVPPLAETPTGGRYRLLFLGRIHPIKGIDTLLKAWRAVEQRFSDWELLIAGPCNDGYLAELQVLAASLGVVRVTFCGPIYGEEKLDAYRAASLFILPSHSENFGNTVAESLAAGTPAIVTRGAPWSGLEEYGAGWWIEDGVDPLVACLERALATPVERLAEMGRAGREWMIRDFSWEEIGNQLAHVYRWLLDGGATPGCVKLG